MSYKEKLAKTTGLKVPKEPRKPEMLDQKIIKNTTVPESGRVRWIILTL